MALSICCCGLLGPEPWEKVSAGYGTTWLHKPGADRFEKISPFLLALTLQACQEAPATVAHDVDAKPLNNIRASYPETMEKLGIDGSASLRCMVTKIGTTTDCRVTQSSRAEFAQAALNYAAAARFEPATRNGVPVQGHHTYNINFSIVRKPRDAPGLLHYACSGDKIGVVLGCRPVEAGAPTVDAPKHAQDDGWQVDFTFTLIPDPARHASVSFLELNYPGEPRKQLPLSDVERSYYFKCPRKIPRTGSCVRIAPEDLATMTKDTSVSLIAVGVAVNGVLNTAPPS